MCGREGAGGGVCVCVCMCVDKCACVRVYVCVCVCVHTLHSVCDRRQTKPWSCGRMCLSDLVQKLSDVMCICHVCVCVCVCMCVCTHVCA